MKTLHVAFFWHMHQPFYRDPVSNTFILPWVRFHSTKGYYDMARVIDELDGVAVTFNLVPSLLKQIEMYTRDDVQDLFCNYTLRPPGDLNKDERSHLLQNFFMCNWETMIKPYPRYQQLYSKRGETFNRGDIDRALKKFSDDDIRDLQVWFNLTWFGFHASKQYPLVSYLKKKGRDFTENEKTELLRIQKQIMKELIPLYRRLQNEGKIEISTSPYYHPILPLLIDTDSATRALDGRTMPSPPFRFPSDAREQITEGMKAHERYFGESPAGLWPSEGSVSPELVDMTADLNLKWIASDQGILMKSLSLSGKKDVLYKPYLAGESDRSIAMVFRDTELSDLIGFTYSRNPAADSVRDFVRRLEEIHDHVQHVPGESLVTLILDGENPWEYFSDGGEEFLNGLYGRLASESWIKLVKIGDYIDNHPPTDRLSTVWSGSWIHQNFDIWIGSQEENAAWNWLRKTREVLAQERKANRLSSLALLQMRDKLFAAESSDWFWWYGDDFASSCNEEFDRLFRANLQEVYRFAGRDVPSDLSEQLLKPKEIHLKKEPMGVISPVLDGSVTNYFEWHDAGCYDASAFQSAMAHSETLFSQVFFGFDFECLYLRIDTRGDTLIKDIAGLNIGIRFVAPRRCRINFPVDSNTESFKIRCGERNQEEETVRTGSVSIGKILEMAIPFDMLKMKPKSHARFYIIIRDDEIEVERCPRIGYLCFQVPDEHIYSSLWSL
ncbi:glycoside hydrolase family 57 protein [Acidobacteriota bacterium]